MNTSILKTQICRLLGLNRKILKVRNDNNGLSVYIYNDGMTDYASAREGIKNILPPDTKFFLQVL